ncbi:hypothetical protein HPB50_014709 [Hyalomma asiaticum]|uniref:Uncharacterized protein n=2 Tax=Hyalomma asiaticum TaxID=266040 RepID=A0ACB7RMX2_HYAAI|nr:hypothetical protein HPB50_008134 [Hyalomma asiaticum]KAH6924296.1 hypothetical protein HPB50_014709 [Hyalomma asiaticum]
MLVKKSRLLRRTELTLSRHGWKAMPVRVNVTHPRIEHKLDTHAPPGNHGGRLVTSATPSGHSSTVKAVQSDTFCTGQHPSKPAFYPSYITHVDVSPRTDFDTED